MTSDETKKLAIGTLLLITYGSRGTQIARVKAVTRTGKVEIDRYTGSYGWMTSKTPIQPAGVISLAPPGDERTVRAQADTTPPIAAR